MLKLKFGKHKVEIPNKLNEINLEQWFHITEVLNSRNKGYVEKKVAILEIFGVDTDITDEVKDLPTLKKELEKITFESESNLEVKDVLSIGDKDYERIEITPKIYRFIEKEFASGEADFTKIVAYVYKLKGLDMSDHIGQTMQRTKNFGDKLSAEDLLPAVNHVMKVVNEFLGDNRKVSKNTKGKR